ncbi:unnamed protein product [Symbiodinium sp. CCMP2592]|nr:unnamed protein product [Symbiodinium sp. CCMP2592]
MADKYDKCVSTASGAWGSGDQDACEAEKPPQSSGLLQKHMQQSAGESLIDDGVHEELKDFLVELAGCLNESMTLANQSGDTVRAKQLETILVYELTAKQASLGTPVDPVLLDAMKDGAASAALAIDFWEILMATISRRDLTDAVINEFTTVLENMATACGDGDEAVEIAGDEKQLLTPTNGGNISETASKVAIEIPMVAWELCQSEVMEVDFFAKHGALLTHTAECTPQVSAALSQKSQHLREDMNYRMKQLLVLHSDENQLGHQLTQHMKQHGVFGHLASPAEDLRRGIRGAAVAELSPKKRAQLEYLQTKKWQTTHGLSRQEQCEKMTNVPDYKHCFCVEEQPELVCEAKHAAELQHAYAGASQKLQHAQEQLLQRKRTQLHANESKILPGPCAPPLSCSMCSGGVCLSASADVADTFKSIQTKLVKSSSSTCFSGSCSISFGWPKGTCELTFTLTLGATITNCQNAGNVLSSFHIHFSASMCLGGAAGAAVAQFGQAIGWNGCHTILSIKYYPFIGKISASGGIPVWFPNMRAELAITVPVHDLTAPVWSWINRAITQEERNAKSMTCVLINDICFGSMRSWFAFCTLEAMINCQAQLIEVDAAIRAERHGAMLTARGYADIDLNAQTLVPWHGWFTFHNLDLV